MGDVFEQALYLKDCYQKEFETQVISITDGKYVVLKETLFYPNSGGQPNDTGILLTESGQIFKIVFVAKVGDNISHEIDHEGLNIGDKVKGIVDWDRRYKHMRYHTASHVLSGIIHKLTNAEITGNQINLDKTRVDFDLENFDREQINKFEIETNRIISENKDVVTKFLTRDEAFQIPAIVKLKKAFPEDIKTIRVVEIVGFDSQACGGTHINNTSEIKGIKMIKAENKGKNNRRVYFELLE